MPAFSISAILSASWEQAISRFGKSPVQAAADKALLDLGRQARSLLEGATPVRTGAMKANWQVTYQPAQKRLTISDRMPYAPYVAFGTSRQQANPNLERVIDENLPELADTQLGAIGTDIIATLARGG